MLNIYTENIENLSLFVAIAGFIWTALSYLFNKKKWWKIICAVLVIAAVYIIFSYTVIGRVAGEEHTFVFFTDPNHNEFVRELFMNALLYYPLGLVLSVIVGPWAILISFLLSFAIEAWQYFAGTGLAQGTDVIMNTLGAAVGTVPFFISVFIRFRRIKDEC